MLVIFFYCFLFYKTKIHDIWNVYDFFCVESSGGFYFKREFRKCIYICTLQCISKLTFKSASDSDRCHLKTAVGFAAFGFGGHGQAAYPSPECDRTDVLSAQTKTCSPLKQILQHIYIHIIVVRITFNSANRICFCWFDLKSLATENPKFILRMFNITLRCIISFMYQWLCNIFTNNGVSAPVHPHTILHTISETQTHINWVDLPYDHRISSPYYYSFYYHFGIFASLCRPGL